MENIFEITAPETCDPASLDLPVLPEELCQLSAKRAEIDVIIFQGTAAGPADMASSANWTGLIDNTDATGAKMKFLVGRGSKADPEDTVFVAARDKEIVTDRVHTITFEVTDVSEQEVYDFIRTLQTGVYTPKFFYQSLGGYLYGKKSSSGADEGITPTKVTARFPKETGKEATDRAFIEIKFSALVDPDRVVSPLAL